MIRIGMLLALAALMGGVSLSGAAFSDEPRLADGVVLAVDRSGGNLLDPAASPPSHYGFTLAKGGAWELTFGRGQSRKGKLDAGAVAKWTKEIQDAGFGRLKSNPALGAADEPFMEITLRVGDKAERRKIRLEERLARAIEAKVAEVTKPGK